MISVSVGGEGWGALGISRIPRPCRQLLPRIHAVHSHIHILFLVLPSKAQPACEPPSPSHPQLYASPTGTMQAALPHMRSALSTLRCAAAAQGCGIVEFESPEEAAGAIQTLNHTELDGRQIFVREDREDSDLKQLQVHLPECEGGKAGRRRRCGCGRGKGRGGGSVLWAREEKEGW